MSRLSDDPYVRAHQQALNAKRRTKHKRAGAEAVAALTGQTLAPLHLSDDRDAALGDWRAALDARIVRCAACDRLTIDAHHHARKEAAA